MRIDEFDFPLPEDRIALRPAFPRDSARLLVVPGGAAAMPAFGHRRIGDLPGLMRPGDVVVFNDSRVIRAALSGRRAPRMPDGSSVTLRINLIERLAPDRFRAFARPGKRLRIGDELELGPGFTAEVTGKSEDGEIDLRFNQEAEALDAAIEVYGTSPLPPYIAARRPADSSDIEGYQTIFARDAGSVADPTAGLHFTAGLMAELAARGVILAPLTLHVGAGTFVPVKAADTDDHVMHSENYAIPVQSVAHILAAKAEGRRVIAIGTTSLRTLEAAAAAPDGLRAGPGATRLFILPGYQFRMVDVLMTNFHLPRSTLFMLVCALGGTSRLRAAYAEAVARGYRFYSYGDAMWIDRVPG